MTPRWLKDNFHNVGIVIDVERSQADTLRATEFFDLGLIDQVRRILMSWGSHDPLLIPTVELLEAAAQRQAMAVQSLINLGTGLSDRFRFGQTPMVIEMLGIPYSGPDPFSILLCRDKHRTKAVVRSVNVQSPPGVFIRKATQCSIADLNTSLFPALVKPNDLGNSIGISNIAVDRVALMQLANDALDCFPDGILVEKFIPGVEATVLILGNLQHRIYSLGLVSATAAPLSGSYFRNFEKKSEILPSGLWRPLAGLVGAHTLAEVEQAALRCWQILECRDAARFDFRIDCSGTAWFIEANGQPELSLSSSCIRYLNMHKFAGNDDGLVGEYLATFFDRIGGFIAC